MKIVAINGSPRGKDGNTHVMVETFLQGAREPGAETINILLAEKEIKHCRGCHSCWFHTPGQCAIKDDMSEVLSSAAGANVIILATPVHFENISGMLKVFMDRMTVTGNPHTRKDTPAENQPEPSTEPVTPKLVMISSCGFPDREEFQVISHWIQRVAQKMRTEIIAEIYATQGKRLTAPLEKIESAVTDFLKYVKQAGKEIATTMELSVATEKSLTQNF
ncbi:MAG TPA: flavodoxin family protein [Bacillota bacterium]|nr:flavodoxin family protein [Bacillota bacterium]